MNKTAADTGRWLPHARRWHALTGVATVIFMIWHGYALYLEARANKDALLQGAASLELLLAVITGGAVALSRVYPRLSATLFAMASAGFGWLATIHLGGVLWSASGLCLVLAIAAVRLGGACTGEA